MTFNHRGMIYELTLESELTDVAMQTLIFQTLDKMRSVGVVIREIQPDPLNPTKTEHVQINVKEKHTDDQRAYFSSVWERIKGEL